jgi:hypothetical protein
VFHPDLWVVNPRNALYEMAPRASGSVWTGTYSVYSIEIDAIIRRVPRYFVGVSMIPDSKKQEFASLFREFAEGYLKQAEGQTHSGRYEESRATGRANFATIEAAESRGEDTTDLVLRLLLPYTDSATHRKSGAWIPVAPAIQGDVKEWFQQAGWTRSEDWPKVSRAILNFVSRCVCKPNSLQEACGEFDELPYTTGFQTGLLTPILNALRPDEFMIVNNKSRRVINFFADRSFKQRLTDYPATNAAGLALVSDLSPSIQQVGADEMRLTDLFDMFSHWLVAVQKYAPIVGQAAGGKVRAATREVVVSVPRNDDGSGHQQFGSPRISSNSSGGS